MVLQYYFTVTFNHDNQKALELRTEDVKDCDEWVAAITQARYTPHTQLLTPVTCTGGDSDVLSVMVNVSRLSLCTVRTTPHTKNDGEEAENVLFVDYFL